MQAEIYSCGLKAVSGVIGRISGELSLACAGRQQLGYFGWEREMTEAGALSAAGIKREESSTARSSNGELQSWGNEVAEKNMLMDNKKLSPLANRSFIVLGK